MLLWLKSKIIMIVACIVLIASLTRFMYIYSDTANDERLQNCCNTISNQINQMSTTDGDEMYQKIVFENHEDGLHLPEKIGDDTYQIRFHQDSIIINQNGDKEFSDLNRDIHLWNPAERNNTNKLTDKEAEWRDQDTESLTIDSGKDNIMTCMLKLENNTLLKKHVFVFKVD